MAPSHKINAGQGSVRDTAARALIFLTAAGTYPVIRVALAKKGYSATVHNQFWGYLHAVAQFRGGLADPTDAVRAAIEEIDSSDDDIYRLSRAATRDDFPEQHAFLFDGFEPASGAGCVLSMRTFLDRVDVLESGKERKATRKADEAALAKMAERGLTPTERERLRGLLTIAQSSLDTMELTVTPPTPDAHLRLKAMLDEWTEVARVVITRRGDLIRLGILRRRKPSKKGDDVSTGVIVAPPMKVGPASTPRGLLAPSTPPPAASATPDATLVHAPA